jgi:Flp pilus assembly pilin Flp
MHVLLSLWCRTQIAARRLREDQAGMTMIEYGILAAFVLLLLVGAATLIGPQLKTWITNTISNIINGNGR